MYYLIFNENRFCERQFITSHLFNNIGKSNQSWANVKVNCSVIDCIVLLHWSRDECELCQIFGSTKSTRATWSDFSLTQIQPIYRSSYRFALLQYESPLSMLINHYKHIGRSRLFDPHLIMSCCLTRTVLKSNKQSCNFKSHLIRWKTLLAAIKRCSQYWKIVALIWKIMRYVNFTWRSLHINILFHLGIFTIHLHASLKAINCWIAILFFPESTLGSILLANYFFRRNLIIAQDERERLRFPI